MRFVENGVLRFLGVVYGNCTRFVNRTETVIHNRIFICAEKVLVLLISYMLFFYLRFRMNVKFIVYVLSGES